MSVLDRVTLEDSTLADLHAIASELGVDGYRRLRKADLIDRLLEHQGGGPTGPVETAEDDEDEDEARGSASRRRRGRRGGRGRGTSARAGEDEESEDEPAEEEPEAADESRPTRSGRRSRGGRSRENRNDGGSEMPREEPEPEIVEGVVELLANGSGFLRLSPPEASEDDVYISAAQVKRCELIGGDRVSGPRRPPHRSERYPSLVRIDSVNGKPASEISDRARFDDLPLTYPTERFKLGSDDETLKAIEFLTPFGRGSRVVIAGGGWSGKTHALRKLAEVLAGVKDLTVLVALAGVRPEEIAEWSAGTVTPAAALSFAASGESQDNAVELVIDQARRLAARGENAAVLIDTLDGLQPTSARKALAAARKIVDGGSLTVIATADAPLGWETTVISLDAKLASTGRYPALDLAASGTLRPELLVGEAGAKAIAKERAKALK